MWATHDSSVGLFALASMSSAATNFGNIFPDRSRVILFVQFVRRILVSSIRETIGLLQTQSLKPT